MLHKPLPPASVVIVALAGCTNIKLTWREGWPDLALGFSFQRSPAPPQAVAPFASRMREAKYTLGPMVEMEVPVFDQNQPQVAKALHGYRQRVAGQGV